MSQETWEYVQYVPCGCTGRMMHDDIIKKGGARQLEDIKNNKQLDAVSFPSKWCPTCNPNPTDAER